MRLLVVRVIKRQRSFGDLSECLEAYVLIRYVSDYNLTSVDLIDQEFSDLSLSLILLEVSMN